MKNVFITEAETVNAGTKFIIRDTAQQVGEHTEKLFKTEQGRDTHLERKGVGILPSEEDCSKVWVKPLTESSSS